MICNFKHKYLKEFNQLGMLQNISFIFKSNSQIVNIITFALYSIINASVMLFHEKIKVCLISFLTTANN